MGNIKGELNTEGEILGKYVKRDIVIEANDYLNSKTSEISKNVENQRDEDLLPSIAVSNSSESSSQEQFSNNKSEKSEGRNTVQINKIFKRKAQSYQDIYSVNSKKKYDHVESKVKQYIASLKEEEKRSRELHMQERTIRRPRSYPDSVDTDNNEEQENLDTRLLDELFRKEKELAEMRRINEYLQSNLNEKLALVARLKRNLDTMRIELLQMQDKLYNCVEGNNNYKNHSKRNVFEKPKHHFLQNLISNTKTDVTYAEKVSVATQTNLLPLRESEQNGLKGTREYSENATIFLDESVSLNSSSEARRRSISPIWNHAEETEHIERHGNNKVSKKKKNVFKKSSVYTVKNTSTQKNNSHKRSTRRRNRWKSWLPCTGNFAYALLCCKETKNHQDDYYYSELATNSNQEDENDDIILLENLS